MSISQEDLKLAENLGITLSIDLTEGKDEKPSGAMVKALKYAFDETTTEQAIKRLQNIVQSNQLTSGEAGNIGYFVSSLDGLDKKKRKTKVSALKKAFKEKKLASFFKQMYKNGADYSNSKGYEFMQFLSDITCKAVRESANEVEFDQALQTYESDIAKKIKKTVDKDVLTKEEMAQISACLLGEDKAMNAYIKKHKLGNIGLDYVDYKELEGMGHLKTLLVETLAASFEGDYKMACDLIKDAKNKVAEVQKKFNQSLENIDLPDKKKITVMQEYINAKPNKVLDTMMKTNVTITGSKDWLNNRMSSAFAAMPF